MDQSTVQNEQADEGKSRRTWGGKNVRIPVLVSIVAIIGALFCLAVVAPPTVDAAAASWEDAVIAGAVSGGVIGGTIGTFLPIPGLGTAGGVIVGVTVGATASYIGYVIGGWGQDGQSASAAEMGKWLANDQSNQTLSKLILAQTNAENVAELAQRSTSYYERSAYYASADLYREQTENSEPHVYDSDYVLDHSMVADESVGSVAGSYAVYNKVLRQLDSISSGYTGDFSGNSITIGVQATNGIYKATQVDYDSHIYFRMASFCNTPAGKYCWLNATDSIILWNLGSTTNDGTVVITDTDGTVVYSESLTLTGNGGGFGIDLSTIAGLESGRYNVQLPQSSWIWTANAAEDYSNSGVVAPGIAVYTLSADSSLTFLWGWAHLPSDQGFSTSGSWSFAPGYVWKACYGRSTSINGGWPYLTFNYKMGTKAYSVDEISLQPYLESIFKVSRSWRTVDYAASLAGQTSYQVLLDNGGVGTDGTSADVLYPPTSIVMPDYDQLNNMTATELLGVYYAYLSQMNETFQHSTIMDPSTVNVSTTSFDMLLRGKVYYNGTLVIDNNTVFILYTTLDGITLQKGKTCDLTSAGYIVTWADGYTSLMDYIKAQGNVQNPNVTYRDVGLGWSIAVEEIALENQEADTANLTVDKLETYVPPDLPDLNGPPSGSEMGSYVDIICLGIIALGVILVLVGIAADNTPAAIIGIVLAVVAAAAWYLSTLDFSLGLWSLANAPSYLQHWR